MNRPFLGLENDLGNTYKSIKPFFWRVLVICLGSYFFGYGFAYFTLVQCDLERDNEEIEPSYKQVLYFLLQSLPSFFAIIGCIIHTPLAKRFSRRNILIISGILGIIGSGLTLVCCQGKQKIRIKEVIDSNFLWIGRSIQGISFGLFSTLCPYMIKELVPLQLSVNLGIFHQWIMSLGTFTVRLVGVFSLNPFLIFGFPLVILLTQIIMLLTVYKEQTPKYYFQNKQEHKARELFKRFYKQQYQQQLFLDARTAHNIQTDTNSIMTDDFNLESIMKKALAIGIYIAILQQLSGITYVIMYGGSPDRCAKHGEDTDRQKNIAIGFSAGWTLLQSLSTFLLVVLNFAFCPAKIKKWSKRRRLFQLGTISCVGVMILALAFLRPFSHREIKSQFLVYIIITIYMGFYGFTIGPATWLYLSQILQIHQMSIAMAFNWLARFVIIFTFPLMKKDSWGNQQILFINLFIFIPLLLICMFINHKYVVQTKNRTRLDIIRDLDAKRLPFNLFEH